MVSRNNRKNAWALFLLVLVGIVLGGFIGSLAANVSFLSWLNFGYSFGVPAEAMVIDLKVIVLTFKLVLNITVSSIIGVVIGIVAYKLL